MEGRLIAQYREFHATREAPSGVRSEHYYQRYVLEGGVKNAPYLLPHIRQLKPTSAIDYGCGHSRLVDILRHAGVTRVARFDPAIPTFSSRPRGFYDLLLSIDVLEHVPEDELDEVLADMSSLAREAIIVVDTVPAKEKLPDGRNAHVTIRSPAWWQAKIASHFSYIEPIRVRARRRAAFKTWPTAPLSRPRMWMTFLNEERHHRIAKLRLAWK